MNPRKAAEEIIKEIGTLGLVEPDSGGKWYPSKETREKRTDRRIQIAQTLAIMDLSDKVSCLIEAINRHGGSNG